jgi:hypothetical protein
MDKKAYSTEPDDNFIEISQNGCCYDCITPFRSSRNRYKTNSILPVKNTLAYYNRTEVPSNKLSSLLQNTFQKTKTSQLFAMNIKTKRIYKNN